MIRAYWLYPPEAPLDSEDALDPVLAHLHAFPLAGWSSYALNGLPSQRRYVPGRLRIDALTQRTQTLTLLAGGAPWQALVTLGKFGERPAALLQTSLDALTVPDAEALEAWLHDAASKLPHAQRVCGLNALAAADADLAPLPTLESPGAWDWVGPDLLGQLAQRPDPDRAPGELTRLRGGLLLKTPPPRWTRDSAQALEAASRWWAGA